MPDRRQTLGVALGAIAAYGWNMNSLKAQRQPLFIPEEAEPHERTFMQWPVNPRVHSDLHFLEMLQQTIADIANAIAQFEPVVMLMDKQHQPEARQYLSENVEIWDVATDDLWCRDSGPVFGLQSQDQPCIINFNFNGWGNKQEHRHDGAIAAKIAKIMDMPLVDTGLKGEPGGVESDGAGTLMAHESSWVNPNRNTISKKEIENKLLTAFGAEKMIWAPGIMDMDITDYHIDSLARFTSPGRVLIQMPDLEHPEDPWTEAIFKTYDILEQAKDANGSKLIIDVIVDPAKTRVKSEDFVASYVNYYVCNGAVISSQFGDREQDEMAREMLQSLYPDREIVVLNTDALGEIGGGIHCATQQQPAFST